jgi:hypothetical protein
VALLSPACLFFFAVDAVHIQEIDPQDTGFAELWTQEAGNPISVIRNVCPPYD